MEKTKFCIVYIYFIGKYYILRLHQVDIVFVKSNTINLIEILLANTVIFKCTGFLNAIRMKHYKIHMSFNTLIVLTPPYFCESLKFILSFLMPKEFLNLVRKKPWTLLTSSRSILMLVGGCVVICKYGNPPDTKRGFKKKKFLTFSGIIVATNFCASVALESTHAALCFTDATIR